MKERDYEIIRHIQRYCDEVNQAVTRFGDDQEAFMADPVFRNAVAMPIQQIGELAKHLTVDFLEKHSEMPWKQIKGMRTWFAHQYLNMDNQVIWEVIHEGIPPLKAFCEQWLNQNEKDACP